MKIANKNIGKNYPVFIIAEAGVNHNGDLEIARKLVCEAKRAGANCVKFQTFKAEDVVTKDAPKAEYQLHTTSKTESQFEMLSKLELPKGDYLELVDLCKKEKILFLSTPYSFEDVDFLETLEVSAFKIASGQIIELSFLEYIAEKSKPIILSTGMATLAEVDEAIRTIRNVGNNDILLLQCTTNYPSLLEDTNLLAMKTMERAFGVPVGYSDHTQSETACITASALGACVIEKHFTVDKTLPGPDHCASANPEEFSKLVKLIRETELVLGSFKKQPTKIEKQNIPGMRRSVVARKFIPAGTRISKDMIIFKRPATGIKPSLANEIIGSVVKKDIPPDKMILWCDIRK